MRLDGSQWQACQIRYFAVCHALVIGQHDAQPYVVRKRRQRAVEVNGHAAGIRSRRSRIVNLVGIFQRIILAQMLQPDIDRRAF